MEALGGIMRTRNLGLLVSSCLALACSSEAEPGDGGTGGLPGVAGTAAAAGSTSSGTAGSTPVGVAGSTSAGTAGSPSTGGTTGSAGAGAAIGGTSGVSGSSSVTGGGGTGGTSGAGGSGGANEPRNDAGMGGKASPGSGGMVAGSGGRASGGSGGGSAGNTSKGGSSSGGSSSTGCSSVGSSMTVNATIVVEAGKTYDGMCRRFIAGSALGDGSQSEDQKPVFKIEAGGTLLNVVLGSPAADGVHVHGDGTLRNIVWEDIGEDALTIKESGTVVLDGGSARNGDDKVFQINAASTFRVSNFKASDAGKFIRQNGDTTFKVSVFIDRCDISNMDEAIFRTDSSSSTVSMTNTRYSNIGDELFIGVSPGNITQSNNTEY